MTTSELEKWAKEETFNKDMAVDRFLYQETPGKVGKFINAECRKDGFLHALELAEKWSKENFINYENRCLPNGTKYASHLIAYLKAYADKK